MGHQRSADPPMSPCARKLQLVQDSYAAGEIDASEKGKLKNHIIGQELQKEGRGSNPMDEVMGSDDDDDGDDGGACGDDGDEDDDDDDDDLSDCEQAEDADEALQEREEQLRAELNATSQRCSNMQQQLYQAKQQQYAGGGYSGIDDEDSDSDSDDED